jgi:hypothetical protein
VRLLRPPLAALSGCRGLTQTRARRALRRPPPLGTQTAPTPRPPENKTSTSPSSSYYYSQSYRLLEIPVSNEIWRAPIAASLLGGALVLLFNLSSCAILIKCVLLLVPPALAARTHCVSVALGASQMLSRFCARRRLSVCSRARTLRRKSMMTVGVRCRHVPR